jgi:threonine dehydratase
VLSAVAIDRSRDAIDPAFTNTPQYVDPALSELLGFETALKIESLNPLRSFKGRGADLFVKSLQPGGRVIAASAGNFGQGIAYAGRNHDQKVTIYAAETANRTKIARMRSFGAKIVLAGRDFDEAKAIAEREAGLDPDAVYVEDGREPLIAIGAGTIAAELAALDPDVVVVPVGNGALIGGMGCWLKERTSARVIGVSAAGAPVMTESWRIGHAISADTTDTIADGIATRVAIPIAVEWTRNWVDDMITVTDDQIRDAMRLLQDVSGLIVEPAAAAGLAAIRGHGITGRRLATVITGSNVAV